MTTGTNTASSSESEPLDGTKTLEVITEDGVVIPVALNLLNQCRTIRNLIKDLGLEAGGERIPITLKSGVFKKVLEWCENHIGITEVTIEEDPTTRERKWFTLTDYEKKFFDEDVEVLSDYLMAANYLDLQTMYVYGCQSFAALLKDKTAEEIREMLGLDDDLSSEEKEEIRRSNVWCSY